MKIVPVVYVDNPQLQIEYKCFHCDFKTKEFKLLHNHKTSAGHDAKALTNIKVTKNDDIKLFEKNQCRYCEKQFETSNAMYNHIRNIHEKDKKIICHVCEKLISKKRMKVHVSNRHLNETHTCNKCPKSFNSVYKLRTHVRFNHGKKDFKCDKCERAFAFGSALKHHLANDHNGNHQCEHCNYKTNSTGAFKTHMRARHTEGKFVCGFCSFESTSSAEIGVHRETSHPDVTVPKREQRKKKCYDCKECDFKTEKRQTAKCHYRSVHLGIIYFCGEAGCSYKGTQKGSLKIHKERVHEKIRKQCMYCEHKAYVLRYHVMRKHPEKVKIYACDKCHYRADSKKMLQRHMISKDRKHD